MNSICGLKNKIFIWTVAIVSKLYIIIRCNLFQLELDFTNYRTEENSNPELKCLQLTSFKYSVNTFQLKIVYL